MTATGTEQQGGALEQGATSVADDAQAAVADAARQAVADPAIDLSTPEGVRAAADRFPALKAVFADHENTGKQRTLSELRREQGTNDRAQRYHEDLLGKIGVAGGITPELAKETPLYVKANSDFARAEVLRGLIAQARTLDEEAVAPLADLADALEGNADEIQKVAQAALNAVANKSKGLARSEVLDIEDLAQIPKDSKLGKALAAAVARETEAEVNAREVEARTKATTITTPGGTSTEPMTRTRLDAMASEERLAFLMGLSDEDRSRMWEIAGAP